MADGARERREAIRQLAELRRRLASAEDALADALAAMKQAEGAFDAASDQFDAAERALDAAREDRSQARQDRTVLDRESRDPAISMANVVAFDLEQVAFDLSGVPIVDLLEFRQQHGGEYQRYASNVRTFAQEVASTPEADRVALLQDRRNELAAEADRLMQAARTWWRQPVASVSVGLVGAVLAGAHHDWGAATLSILTGIVGASGRPDRASVYSYLFRTGSRFGT